MLEISDFIILALAGCVGGFLSGFLGVGGGIIYVPILDYFLSKYFTNSSEIVKAVLANSLFTILFSATIASYKQYRLGNFYLKEITLTAIPGIVTVVAIHTLINHGNWYSRKTFLWFFLIMLLFVVVKMFLSKAKNTEQEVAAAPNFKYYFTGGFAGIVTAMSGLGGGVIMTPIFTEWLKINIKKASAISTGVIPAFAFVVGVLNLNEVPETQISQWQMGFIIFPVVLPLILATFVFAPLGVKMAQKSNSKTIQITFASFASLILLKVIYELFVQ